MCFPHAGGSASFFLSWADHLPDGVELLAACYPGREDRLLDPPAERMPELVAPLAEGCARLRDVPQIFFGHSMGASVGFEVALHLERTGWPAPRGLFLSGRAAPGNDTDRPRAGLTDDELLDDLSRMGGTDDQVLLNPELRALVLPAIRADYRLLQRYDQYPSSDTVTTSLVAYYGTHDSEIDESTVTAWSRHTRSSFAVRAFSGGHFYLLDHTEEIIGDIFGRISGPV